MAPSLLLVAALLFQSDGKPRLKWSRDYDQAFVQAEERKAPVLIHLRGQNCELRTAPMTVEERAGGTPQVTELSDCDLMQQEVWENQKVAGSAQRFVPVLVDGGNQALNVRYQVIVNPTTIIADPWGNEMFRVAGYLAPDKMDRVLNAVPKDFTELTPWARALRQDGSNPKALLGAAGYYESQGLRQVSERLYDKALSAPTLSTDLPARRQVVLARGLNLLMMGRDKDAAGVFQKELGQDATGAGSDALLLGLVNAHLQGGRRSDADAAVKALETSFPKSPYTARAKQNLQAAKK